MRARTVIASLIAVAGFTLVGGNSVRAGGGACIDDAVGQYKECQGQCKEDFQTAKDACLNRDHDCVEVCRAKRDSCVQDSGLGAAIDACNAALHDAKQNCRNDPMNPPGSAELDHCIDQAQVVAFQCRDQARENAKPALKQCRKDFRDCAKACPPGAGAPIDPVQCKIDAKTALKTCRTNCREDFQVAKDACHNRDHACVEQCRADRDTCRQPVDDQLDTAIAACNAQLATDKANCLTAFPNPGTDQDQCIDNAQVTAFVCRDNAREAARPGIENCRQQFKTCVLACPPAS